MIVGAVDEDEAFNTVWRMSGQRLSEVTAHGLPDEKGATTAHLVEHGCEVIHHVRIDKWSTQGR